MITARAHTLGESRRRRISSFLAPAAFVAAFLLLPAGALYAQVDLTTLLAATKGTLQWNTGLDYGVILAEGNELVFSPGMSWGLFNYTERLDTGEIRRGSSGDILFTAAGAKTIEAALARPRPSSEAAGQSAAPAGFAGGAAADPAAAGSTGAGPNAARTDAGVLPGRSAPAARAGKPRIAAVIIDPGHGGKDPGTISDPLGPGGSGRPLEEKDLVLTIGLQVFHELKGLYPDKDIVITRDTDAYVSLERRAQIANDVRLGPGEAKIFVSIHANASLNKAAHGYEVWYLPPSYQRTVITPTAVGTSSKALFPILNNMAQQEYETESILLAKDLVAGVQQAIGTHETDRGLKSNPWFVVRNVRMPAVLIEVGFVTNPEEARLLGQKSYLVKLAHGIAGGIAKFVNFFDSQDGFTN